jgi:hypothetical protein
MFAGNIERWLAAAQGFGFQGCERQGYALAAPGAVKARVNRIKPLQRANGLSFSSRSHCDP